MGNQQHWDKKHAQTRVNSMLGSGLAVMRDVFDAMYEAFTKTVAGEASPVHVATFEKHWAEQKARFDAQFLEHAKELISHRKFVMAMGPEKLVMKDGYASMACRICRLEWEIGAEQRHQESADGASLCAYASLMKELKG